ncbi:MAG: hypothetical protein RIR12_2616 [Bacteroidota bacterium]|jgi:hypothetical protein
MSKKNKPDTNWIKFENNCFGHDDFYIPQESKKKEVKLTKALVIDTKCQKVCSRIIELLPETTVEPNTGRGSSMINIDGFRYINVYVIGERVTHSDQKGFSLRLSFSVNPFVLEVGVVGETHRFFNFDTYYNKDEYEKKLNHISNSYETSPGYTHLGGVDNTYMVRVPVMGAYVRVGAINNDSMARKVKVAAYLTT